ncbi:hypothetical protein LCER1_G007894 [Lachnellula cervina]|uniref:Uncharacterized protein n=1 Tax=Lachnellula cervina TaxID=1316786 RepID=A0A7D8YJF3_9HELO|nr:hypothetical protein LCER1_G007894 [Lachnellula cervina]
MVNWILIGFKSANNFLVISTKNLIIKEDLVYTNEYNKSDDNNYLELLELSYSEDNTDLGGAKASDLPSNNSSSNNNYNNSSSNSDNQEDHDILIHNNLSNYNELSLDHYQNPDSNNKRKVNSTLASYAYITSKIEDNSPKENSSNKVIIYKNQNTINSIYKPKSYNEAKNSKYKDFWSKAEAKEIKTLESNNA